MPHHYTFVLIATDFDPKELPPGLTHDEVTAKLAPNTDTDLHPDFPRDNPAFMAAYWQKVNDGMWEGEAGQPPRRVIEHFGYPDLATFDQKQAGDAAAYIKVHANDTRPMFMYVSFTKMHNPTNPAPDFKGKSHASLYLDSLRRLARADHHVLAGPYPGRHQDRRHHLPHALTLRIRPFHIADDGLPAIVHMDALDADKLLAADEVIEYRSTASLKWVHPRRFGDVGGRAWRRLTKLDGLACGDVPNGDVLGPRGARHLTRLLAQRRPWDRECGQA